MHFSKAMKKLHNKLETAQSELQALLNDENAKTEDITAKTTAVTGIKSKIDAQTALDDGKTFDANGEEVVDTTPVNPPVITAQPRGGKLREFRNFTEQLIAIKNAANGTRDERLVKLNNAAGMNETIGTEGGFAVQTDFAGLIMESAATSGNILPLVDRYEVSGNSNAVKWVDTEESSVATTVFGGVQVYWAAEAAQVAASQPALKEKRLELEKLMGLAYATYELEADSDFVSQLYSKSFAKGIQRALEGAIIAGSGISKPLGLLNAGSKVAVAKESGQTANTIVWENIVKMYNRALDKDNISKYVWLAHPDTADQIDFLEFPIGTGGVPVYLPAAQVGSVATLKGKPIIETDHCSQLGSEGDIIFADLNDYLLITKGGVQSDSSIHVQFLTAENAFRFIFRANGMPKRSTALTIKNSSSARSNIITLANRA